MKRKSYIILWRMRGEPEWTELGTHSGRVDTFRTKRLAEKKCRWLKRRNKYLVTRIVAPPKERKRRAQRR